MNEIINWIVQNRVELLAIFGSLLAVATAIARLTPTMEDDKIIEKIRKIFEKVSTLGLPDVRKK